MERYYFTFMQRDVQYRNCYHVEEAESYGKARDKMIERFGTDWAFQYSENEWNISEEKYNTLYRHDPAMPNWYKGITQASLFNLKEI